MPVKICNIVEKLEKTGRCARIYMQAFHGKTRTNNKPKTTGKQTAITFNKSQKTKATLGLYILYTGG